MSKSQPMTMATPIPDANGIPIARNPQISIRIPQIIPPLPVRATEVESFIAFFPFRLDRPQPVDRSVVVSQYLSRNSVTIRIHLCKPFSGEHARLACRVRRLAEHQLLEPAVAAAVSA